MFMSPISDHFAELSYILPRIAEEGGDREEISEIELAQLLTSASGFGAEQAKTVVAIARGLLRSLSVLDERCLAAGEWAFVSFPAFLLTRSLLGGLDAPEYRLLEQGYWDPSDYRVERQRALIKGSEERRAAMPSGSAPIRRVWVSWAPITINNKFLMVRREDTSPHRDGSRGQFVFPGGRVSEADLPELVYLTPSDRLDFFDPLVEIDQSHIRYALSQALRRELVEELEIPANGLAAGNPASEIIRYKATEGAKSSFAATEYHIQPFLIEFNVIGTSALLRCLAANPDRFEWFTADELEAGVNSKGAKAFVDAVRQSGLTLESITNAIPIGDITPNEELVDIPGKPGEPFVIGTTGREKQVFVDLDANEIETLAWLAAVRHGSETEQLASGVTIATGTGWVLIENDSILTKLKILAAKLEDKNLPLLNFHEHAVCLNAGKSYFSRSLLLMEIEDEHRGKSYRLTMSRRRLQSPLGVAKADEATTALPEVLGNAVYALDQGDPQPALDNIETVKRMQRDIRGYLDSLGVRLLIRQVDGVPELAVGKRHLG